MDPHTLRPRNLDERLIWYTLLGTYGFYAVGALYVVGPVLGWVLLARLAWRWYARDPRAPETACTRVSPAAWIWCLGMALMLIALVVAHLGNDLGAAKLVKSAIGWAKGWALLAIFVLAGALPVRPELLYRAGCVVALQTLVLAPVFVAAWARGLPQTLWVSPLQILGGPGPEFFALSLYEIDPGSGLPRWRLFTPWAPALGFMANVYFLFALRERHAGWRSAGVAGSVLMCLMSQSRLALVGMALVAAATWLLGRLTRPGTWIAGGLASGALGLAAVAVRALAEDFVDAFEQARADSTRVRAALARIALERWRSEAPVWGHGIVERGPHLVEFMPIGSHHTWYGLLFVKGAVGLAALALPLMWSFLALLGRAQREPLARAGLGVVLVLFLYTFGENLEILVYLFWPAQLLLGLSLNTSPDRGNEP